MAHIRQNAGPGVKAVTVPILHN